MRVIVIIGCLIMLVTGGCAGGEDAHTAAPQQQATDTTNTNPPETTPPATTTTTPPSTTPPATNPPPATTPPVTMPPIITPPPATETVTLNFQGTFASSLIIGTFTYEKAIGPTATNIRSLTPNVVYPLISWSFTVTTPFDDLPSNVYSNTFAGDTAVFCVGVCNLGPAGLHLLFKNAASGTPYALSLFFNTTDPTPYINPPTKEEWSTMRQGTYGIPCPVCVPVAVLNSGFVF